ncbi:M16 family metallopeptidase [Desulfopila aestuarii]|nr:M16 family metallopeptidase [Desulfopila aestuarii]
MENHEPENRVALFLYVHTGSLNETDEQRGVAHYLEHMQFNGTTHFPPGQLVKFFQDIGMSFGGDTNAHTSYDETVYRIDLPKGSQEYLKKGFLVMSDYARGALLTEEEVERERGVIIAEKRSRDSAKYRSMVAASRYKYDGTLLPKREVIGIDSVLLHADSKLLRSYYDSWYHPQNMLLVVVGDVEPSQTVSLIGEMFEPLKGIGKMPPCPEIGEVHHKGTKVFYHPESELGRTNIAIETFWNEQPRNDSRNLQKEELLRYASIMILHNRLQQLQEKKSDVLTDAGYYSGDMLERIRYSTIMAATTGDKWQETLGLLDTILRQALVYGVTQDELERVKMDILASLDSAVLTAGTRDSEKLGREIIRQFGDNRVYLSPAQERELYGGFVRQMKVEDLNSLLQTDWLQENRIITLSGDVAIEEQDPQEVVLKTYEEYASKEVVPFQGARLEQFPYLKVPEKSQVVVKEERFPDIGAERVELANNVAITFKKTTYEANTVRIMVDIGRGKLSEPVPGLSLLAEGVVNDSGTMRLSSIDLAKTLAGKTVDVNFGVGQESFRYSGRAVVGESELLIQLIYHLLQDPALRDQAWTRTMGRLQQMYAGMAKDIQGAISMEVETFLAGGDPRVGLPPWPQVRSLQLEQLRSWLLPEFASGSLEVTIVGDFDPVQMQTLAMKYFGALSQRQENKPEFSEITFPVGQMLRTSVDTSVQKSIVIAAWPTADFWDIHRTRRLNILADIFQERLRQVIREKLGASYAPAVYSAPSRIYTGYGRMQVQVVVAPGHEDAILAEIEKIAIELKDDGISSTELARAKGPLMTGLKDVVKSNDYWMNSVLAGSKRHPQQLQWPLSMIDDFQGITEAEIEELAVRYLIPAKMAKAVVSPSDRR